MKVLHLLVVSLLQGFWLLCSSQSIPAGVCAPLASTSFCQDILSPAYATSVFIAQSTSPQTLNASAPASNCQQGQEASIQQKGVLLFAALASVPTCQNSFAKYLCSYVYPMCVQQPLGAGQSLVAVPLQPCASDAQQLQTACGGASSAAYQLLQAFVGAQINASALQTSPPNCMNINSTYTPVSIPQPSCSAYSGTFCQGLVSYPVYLPAALKSKALSTASIETQLAQLDFSLGLAASSAPQCAVPLRKQICAKSLLRCDTTVLTNSLNAVAAQVPSTESAQFQGFQQLAAAFPIPFPQLPCQTDCQQTSLQCQAIFKTLPPSVQSVLGANCSAVGDFIPATTVCGIEQSPAVADFQSSSFILGQLPTPFAAPLNSLPLTTTCSSLSSAASIPLGVCAPLASNSLCQDIFPASRSASVFIAPSPNPSQSLNITGPSSNCQSAQEAQITQKGALLFAALAAWPSCQSFFASFLCSSVYPACSTSSQYGAVPLTACASDATQLQQLCGGVSGPAWLLLSAFMGSMVNNQTLPSAPQCASVAALSSPSYIPKPSCGTYAGSYCAGVVNYPVYIPATLHNASATYQPAAIESRLQSTNFLYALAPLATNCPSAFRKQMCSKYLLKCDTTILPTSLQKFAANLPSGTNPAALAQLQQFATLLALPQIQVPFPSLPCMDTCTYFSDAACPSLITKIPASQYSLFGVNCSTSGLYVPATQVCGLTLSSALPDYQPSSYTLSSLPLPTALAQALSVSSVPLLGSCNSMGVTYDSALGSVFSFNAYAESNVTTNVITCPSPLVVADEPDCRIQGGSCAVPCPSFLYDQDTLHTNRKLFLALVILSFSTSSVFVATWLVFAEKRRFVYILIFSSYAWLLSLLFVVSYSQKNWDELEKVNCRNNCATWGWAEDSWCTFEGSMIQYLPSNVTSWWLVLCLDLWWKVRVNIRLTKQQEKVKHLLLLSLGFGYPMVLFLIGFGVHGYGGTKTGTVPWCFYANYDAQDVIFYYPLTALIGLGFLTICDLLYLLTKHAFITGGMTGAKGMTRWRAHIRPLIFLLEILIILVLVVSNRFYTLQNTTKFTAAATAYVTCLLGAGGGVQLCGSSPANGPDRLFGLYMLTFGVAASPLLMSAAHLTHPRVFRLWYELICKRNLQLISRVSATTSNSRSSGGKVPSVPVTMKERSSVRGTVNYAASQPPSQIQSPKSAEVMSASGAYPPAISLEQLHPVRPSATASSSDLPQSGTSVSPSLPAVDGGKFHAHAMLPFNQRSSLTVHNDSVNGGLASTSLAGQRPSSGMPALHLPETVDEYDTKSPKHFI